MVAQHVQAGEARDGSAPFVERLVTQRHTARSVAARHFSSVGNLPTTMACISTLFRNYADVLFGTEAQRHGATLDAVRACQRQAEWSGVSGLCV